MSGILQRLVTQKDKDLLKRRIFGGMVALSGNRPVASATAAAATTEDNDTGGFLVIQHDNTDTGALIKPLYIRLYTTTAGTNGTDLSAQIALDAAQRYSSGGAALVAAPTVKEVRNSAEVTPPTAIADVYAGALTLTANTNEVTVAYPTLKSAIVAAGDNFTIAFGEEGDAAAGVGGTAASTFRTVVPEVTVGPASSMVVRLYSTAQTVASQFYVEVCWAEVGRNE